MSEDLMDVLDDLRDHTTVPFFEEIFSRAYVEIGYLRTELKKALEWNQSVAVCCDHVKELVRRDGCVICRLEELEKG